MDITEKVTLPAATTDKSSLVVFKAKTVNQVCKSYCRRNCKEHTARFEVTRINETSINNYPFGVFFNNMIKGSLNNGSQYNHTSLTGNLAKIS